MLVGVTVHFTENHLNVGFVVLLFLVQSFKSFKLFELILEHGSDFPFVLNVEDENIYPFGVAVGGAAGECINPLEVFTGKLGGYDE